MECDGMRRDAAQAGDVLATPSADSRRGFFLSGSARRETMMAAGGVADWRSGRRNVATGRHAGERAGASGAIGGAARSQTAATR